MTTPIPPSLPPVGGGGPSFGPIPFSGPSSSTTDGLSAYSADIAAGNELTIKQFSHIVLSATNENNTVIWNTEQFNATSRQEYYIALVLDGLAALEILRRQTQDIGEYKTIVSDNQVYVDQVNTNILYYNDNVTTLPPPNIATLNQAIDDYNNGDIDMDELNTAIDSYNNEVDYFNSQVDQANLDISNFNDQAAIYNQSVALINASRPPGIDPFVGQTLITETAAHMPTTPHITGSESGDIPHAAFTPTTLHTISNTMSPALANIDPILKNLNDKYTFYLENQLALSTAILQAQSSHTGFVQFYLQGIIPLLPPAFSSPAIQPALSAGGSGGTGGAGGAGSGVSLASIITSLSNPLMNAIIAQSIFAADMHLQSLPATSAAVAQLQFLSLSLLSQVGLQAGSLAVRLLANRLAFVDVRSSPVSVALGLTLASEISLAVSSGAIARAVKELLADAYPELNPEKRDTLSSQLTAAIELILLQSAVFQLSQTLKTPLLSSQLLGTLSSTQPLGLTSNPTVNTNPEALKSALARNLAAQLNTSYADATQLISHSLISAATQEQFDRQTIIDELVQKGVSNKDAVNTANYAQVYVKAEVSGRGLLDEVISQERLKQSILANPLVNQLVAGQSNMTNRDLRDQLAQQFVNSGNTQGNALLAATLAVVGNGGITPTDPEVLKSSLLQTATTRLAGLGNSSSETQGIANQLVSTVLGPNVPGSQTSLRDLIDERLQTLLKSGDQNLVNAVKTSLNNFLEPTTELYAFAESLRDPANTFLLCAQTGLMYSHPQPSNYLKSVDISV